MKEETVQYEAVAIILHDSNNQSLTGTLNFTITHGEEGPYDSQGAAYYVCAVILVYGLSMVLLIASLAKRKMNDKISDQEEGQVNQFLQQMPSLREKNDRENYRQLKRSIKRLVSKEASNASTKTSASEEGTLDPSKIPIGGIDSNDGLGSEDDTGKKRDEDDPFNKRVSFEVDKKIRRTDTAQPIPVEDFSSILPPEIRPLLSKIDSVDTPPPSEPPASETNGKSFDQGLDWLPDVYPAPIADVTIEPIPTKYLKNGTYKTKLQNTKSRTSSSDTASSDGKRRTGSDKRRGYKDTTSGDSDNMLKVPKPNLDHSDSGNGSSQYLENSFNSRTGLLANDSEELKPMLDSGHDNRATVPSPKTPKIDRVKDWKIPPPDVWIHQGGTISDSLNRNQKHTISQFPKSPKQGPHGNKEKDGGVSKSVSNGIGLKSVNGYHDDLDSNVSQQGSKVSSDSIPRPTKTKSRKRGEFERTVSEEDEITDIFPSAFSAQFNIEREINGSSDKPTLHRPIYPVSRTRLQSDQNIGSLPSEMVVARPPHVPHSTMPSIPMANSSRQSATLPSVHLPSQRRDNTSDVSSRTDQAHEQPLFNTYDPRRRDSDHRRSLRRSQHSQSPDSQTRPSSSHNRSPERTNSPNSQTREQLNPDPFLPVPHDGSRSRSQSPKSVKSSRSSDGRSEVTVTIGGVRVSWGESKGQYNSSEDGFATQGSRPESLDLEHVTCV